MNRTIKGVLLLGSGCILLWLANDSLLYYRDNFSTHFPVQSAIANLVRDGLPLWNPLIDGGQPLAGNPNNLTFYPSTLLYLILPSHFAFNLHFLLHLVVAWFGMKRLLETYEVSSEDSRLVATIYLFSGAIVSCLVFYNLIVAAALMPWALSNLVRLLEARRLRNALYLGVLCGLIGLAAEPTIILGFSLACTTLFISRFSRRTIAPLALSVAIACIVASPQIFAFLEISAETERAQYPFSVSSSLAASLGPLRVAEIITGPVHGSVLDHSANGYWNSQSSRPWPPFFMSILMTAFVLPALMRRRRELLPFQAMAAIFLLVSIGSFNPVLAGLLERFESLRIIRYPEKFALLITLVATVPLGFLFRDLGRSNMRKQGAASIIVVALVTAAVLLTTPLTTASSLRLLAVSLLQTIGLAALVVPERLRPRHSVLGLVCILPLALWATWIAPLDDETYYTTPSPVADLVGDDVIAVQPADPDPAIFDPVTIYRYYAFRLNPSIGISYGIPYALSGSPEGMHSYLSRLSAERFRAADPETMVHYLRIHGTAFAIRSEPAYVPGLRLADSWRGPPLPVLAYEVIDPRPFLWQPSSVTRAATATEAVRIIESSDFDPSRDTVVPAWIDEALEPSGSATIRMLDRDSQRLRFEVSTARRTIVVINQSWFSAWRAHTSEDELTTFPADIDRLGLIVPAGTSTVCLEFGRHRITIAVALVLSAATLIYALGVAIVSRRRTAEPAR